jgi:hypothetical protein
MPARSVPVQPNLEHLKNQAKALRTQVQASRGLQDAVRAFLAAAMNRDRAAALSVLRTEPASRRFRLSSLPSGRAPEP